MCSHAHPQQPRFARHAHACWHMMHYAAATWHASRQYSPSHTIPLKTLHFHVIIIMEKRSQPKRYAGRPMGQLCRQKSRALHPYLIFKNRDVKSVAASLEIFKISTIYMYCILFYYNYQQCATLSWSTRNFTKYNACFMHTMLKVHGNVTISVFQMCTHYESCSGREFGTALNSL